MLLSTALVLCALGLARFAATLAGAPAGPFAINVHGFAATLMAAAVASILASWRGRAWLSRQLASLALVGSCLLLVLQAGLDLLPSLAPALSGVAPLLPTRQAILSIVVTALIGLPLPRRRANEREQ